MTSLPSKLKSGLDLFYIKKEPPQKKKKEYPEFISDNYSVSPPIQPIVHLNSSKETIEIGSTLCFDFYCFENCSNCIIDVNHKITKLVILGSRNITINVDNPLIGTIDIIRSTNVKLYIRSLVNIIQIDISSNVEIDQYIEQVSYIASHSMEISVNYLYGSSNTDEENIFSNPEVLAYNIPINEYTSTQQVCVINSNGMETMSLNFFR